MTASIQIPASLQGPQTFEHSDPLYNRDDVVKHYKGTHYRVIFTPADGFRTEAGNEPAYAYCKADEAPNPTTNPIWVRAQAEFEDTAKFMPV